MRIAIAQTCPVSAQPGVYSGAEANVDDLFITLRRNLEDAEQIVKDAVQRHQADVVCFPEYFLQGILNEGRQYLSITSQWLDTHIAGMARRYSVAITGTIVHGACEGLAIPPQRDPFEPASVEGSSSARQEWVDYLGQASEALANDSNFRLVNEAFYFDDKGEKRGRYTKKNLWHPEREYLEPGTIDEPVFTTPWGKAGFLICWDLSHPAAAQSLADQGADIIFAPAYWLGIDSEPMVSRYTSNPDYELNLLQSLCSARAFETETVLIHTNPGGSRSEGFMGGSGVWAPLIGKVGGYDEGSGDVGAVGVKIVELDLGVLSDARELYKIREDAAIRNAT